MRSQFTAGRMRTRFNTSLLGLISLVVAASVLPAAQAKADNNKSEPKLSNVCELIINARENFDQRKVIRKLSDELDKSTYKLLAGFGGFSLTRDNTAPTQTVEVSSRPNDYGQTLSKQIWKSQKQKFEFVDIGFKNLEIYSDRVNRYVFRHLMIDPNENLVIKFDRTRAYIGQRLNTYRWAAHGAVIDLYKRTKPYLRRQDYRTLSVLNQLSGNNDVYALLSPKNNWRSETKQTKQEIAQRLLLTIQISYFGNRMYYRPSMSQMFDHKPDITPEQMFPFEYRIPREKRAEFREKFYSRFSPFETCEMLRYASFDNQTPQEIRDEFLLQAFQRIRDRGMRYIVASADRFSARLYRRYGFQIFSELPTDQTDEPEYILYLRVHSREFREMFERLQKSAEGVKIRTKTIRAKVI